MCVFLKVIICGPCTVVNLDRMYIVDQVSKVNNWLILVLETARKVLTTTVFDFIVAKVSTDCAVFV